MLLLGSLPEPSLPGCCPSPASVSHFQVVTWKIKALPTSCGWSKTFWKSPNGDPENSPKIFLKSSSGSIDGPLLQYCRPAPAPAAPVSKLAVPYASYCFRFTSSLRTCRGKRCHQDPTELMLGVETGAIEHWGHVETHDSQKQHQKISERAEEQEDSGLGERSSRSLCLKRPETADRRDCLFI